MRASHGWAHVGQQRKREIIEAIVSGRATSGPVHAELDLTDRCNIDCYFCNQMDVRSKQQVALPHAVRVVDELVEGGLRSVRLSGGGDPLFHRDILAILDHLASRNVVIDNVTTNGVALSPEVAQRLVNNEAREVVVSLNTVDPTDYHRMMQVRPDLFERVLQNIRHLLAVRGERQSPAVVVQFMLDRQTYLRTEEMYELGKNLGVDRIAINQILEIPRERIDRDLLLTPVDAEPARPHLRRILEADRDAGLLQIDFAVSGWNEMLQEVRRELGIHPPNDFPTAPSFREENGQCFFAWYTTTVTGTGDMYPCCLLQTPDNKPLGNVLNGSVASQWNGPGFTRLRDEMREVMLLGGEVVYRPSKFQAVKRPCVEKNLCWLKNMFFRADEDFYRELGEALAVARKREVGWIGPPKNVARAAEVAVFRHVPVLKVYDAVRLFYLRVHWHTQRLRKKLASRRQS